MKIFPAQFDLNQLTGSRAKAFPKQEDAFQQLIGDRLRTIYGPGAFVSPTRGRDGGIDAYVDSSEINSEKLFGLPLPLIVECKYHNPSLDVHKNINQGWTSVAQKLSKNAENGWPDLFTPWQSVKSYAYCLSCDFLNLAAKQEFEEKISKFFFELKRQSNGNINVPEKIQVIDWSTIRNWLQQDLTIVDGWLGTELDSIVPLENYLESLTGLQNYLDEKKLPFVSPDSPELSPQKIFETLETSADEGGILLYGPGGVGKTRTGIETGKLALAKGWRVLVLLPGESNINVNKLADVIQNGRKKTLIICDYLDQMQQLDLNSIRRLLIPQASLHGTKITLLATSRPGWLLKKVPERDALFSKQISLDPSADHREKVTLRMVRSVAPNAIKAISEEVLQKKCGTRPMLALLIAREMEKLALENKLKTLNLGKLQPGDLLFWLQRRLGEDKLTTTPSDSIWSPDSPGPDLTLISALFICMPQLRSALISLASKSVTAERIEHIVEVLERLGWAEVFRGQLTSAHDVVTDYLAKQILFNDTRIRKQEFNLVCSFAAQNARSLGRLWTSLERLFHSLEKPSQDSLEESWSDWMTQNNDLISILFKNEDVDTVSYALGAAFSGPPILSSVTKSWDLLISPWLQSCKPSLSHRHLYYRGLRFVEQGHATKLINQSISWLRIFETYKEASFVFRSLLERDDLEPARASEAVTFAISWLQKHSQDHHKDANFVICALLKRKDLEPAQAAALITFSVTWLQRNSQELEAIFVFEPIFERTDIASQTVTNLITLAIEWCLIFYQKYEFRFVASALLKRPELETKQINTLAPLIPKWINRNPSEAAFSLGSWLNTIKLNLDSDQFINYSMKWIEDSGEDPKAHYVYYPLLERTDLNDIQAKSLTSHAIAWLQMYPNETNANYILRCLLERVDLTESQVKSVIQLTFAWLQSYHEHADARYVLRPLLKHENLDENQAKDAISFTFLWLKVYQNETDVDYIFRSLLKRADLTEHQVKKLIQLTVGWLHNNHERSNADYVFRSLLERTDLTKSQVTSIIPLALGWLQINREHADSGYVLRPLLTHGSLDTEQSRALISTALGWLQIYREHADSGYVLRPLLTHGSLDVEQSRVVISTALEWLKTFCEYPHADYVLSPLLRRKDLNRVQTKATITFAVMWLGGFHSANPYNHLILSFLLDRRDLTEDQAISLASSGVSWLNNYHDHIGARDVLQSLLKRKNLTEEQAATVISFAFARIKAFGHRHTETQLILELLLRRKDLTTDQINCLIPQVVEWVECIWADQSTTYTFSLLLWRFDLVKKHERRIIPVVISWLESFLNSRQCEFILLPLLKCVDLEGYYVPRIIQLAAGWLHDNSESPNASFVFGPLLNHPGLTESETTVIIASGMKWLHKNFENACAPYVFSPLIASGHLSPENVQKIIPLAIGWFRKFQRKLETSPLPVIPAGLITPEEPQATKIIGDWFKKYLEKC